MAAPWEKYQKTETEEPSGPWSKFKQESADTARRVPTESEVPTAANLAADRARPVLPDREKGIGERTQEVAGNIFPLARSFTRKGAAELLGPAISAVTTTGGAALGTPLGPGGMVGGGALGYGIGEEIVRRIRGDAPTPLSQTAKDVLIGGALEAGGRGVVAPLVEKTARGGARLIGGARDLFDLSTQRAAKIARQSVGPENVPRVRQALQAAIGDDVTAAQAIAAIGPDGRPMLNMPVVQALLKRAEKRDPRFFTDLFGAQDAARFKQLEQIAAGANQTEARAAQAEMQDLLNQRLIPTLKQEMGAANIAGELAPGMEREAARLRGAAADKVEDVRRFTAAGERAAERAGQTYPVPGYPRVPGRYTYMDELSQKADEVADQAAQGSLIFGEAARFKEAARQSLEAHGLRPLTGDSILTAINRRLADPKLAAGNRDLQTALGRVADDIRQWTNNDGIIDAWALDNIRKNSINAYINSLPINPKQARKLAADLTEQIRPVLIDAVETAGGTGYRQYLKNYSLGMQQIAQTKVGAEAMKMYADNPAAFVKLVEGNDPKKIEKIFGPGNYNIFKELSQDIQGRFRGIADQIKRDKAIEAQADAGAEALKEILEDNLPRLRIPNFLNVFVTTTNEAITALEKKIGKRSLQILTEAAKSAGNFDKLLATLPAAERNAFLRALSDPETFRMARTTAGGVSAGLVQEKPQTNTLSQTRMGGITDVNPRIGAR